MKTNFILETGHVEVKVKKISNRFVATVSYVDDNNFINFECSGEHRETEYTAIWSAINYFNETLGLSENEDSYYEDESNYEYNKFLDYEDSLCEMEMKLRNIKQRY